MPGSNGCAAPGEGGGAAEEGRANGFMAPAMFVLQLGGGSPPGVHYMGFRAFCMPGLLPNLKTRVLKF